MRKNKNRIAWHYTYSHHIDDIFESGVLLPPAALHSDYWASLPPSMTESRGYQADEKLLLFSENPLWEPASYRGVYSSDGTIVNIHSLEDYPLYGFTVYRIAVPTYRLKPYTQLLREVHMPKEVAKPLAESARKLGSNPYQWWGTTKPIPEEHWLSVEVYEDGRWVPYEDGWSESQVGVVPPDPHPPAFEAGVQ
jgi:hypothetical protein